MNVFPPCRICTSPYVTVIQDVLGNRTGRRYPQHFCMDCQSLFHVSGYQESVEQKDFDFDFLVTHRDMHYALMNRLFLELKSKLSVIETCCEIGFGLGNFMRAARDYGTRPFGFEVNERCYDHVSKLGFDCTLGYFDDAHEGSYDLIAAIMVFEHLEHPRALFQTMMRKLNRDGAIYLCVPFVERHEWRYLWKADTAPDKQPPDPFYDNDVHITHYSIEGLRRLGLGMGARSAEHFISEDVWNKSPGAYPGILFRF